MKYEPEFRASLLQDLEENNPVKIELRRYPWEITGKVQFVGELLFDLDTTPPGTMYRISDILTYRCES